MGLGLGSGSRVKGRVLVDVRVRVKFIEASSGLEKSKYSVGKLGDRGQQSFCIQVYSSRVVWLETPRACIFHRRRSGST